MHFLNGRSTDLNRQGCDYQNHTIYSALSVIFLILHCLFGSVLLLPIDPHRELFSGHRNGSRRHLGAGVQHL